MDAAFLSPLQSGLFNWNQLARVLGRDVRVQSTWLSLGTWAALRGSVVRQKLCFYESWWCAASERKAAKGQKRKLWLWFRLHSKWQYAIFTLCFFSLFTHSVIFLCSWMKWPNFSRLYWMSRCNLTKCCSESWLYGFSFQTLVLFSLCIHTDVCVCVPACNSTWLQPLTVVIPHTFLHNLPNLGALSSFFCSYPAWRFWHWHVAPRDEGKKTSHWKVNHTKLCLNLAGLLLTDRS